jgi:vacuolar-type H+-ATPase subunit H
MELQQLINQLEHVISQGKRVPLSQNIMVDEEAVRRVIDQMRVSVPDMIKQAERTVGERDRIVAQANEEASRIVQLAREQATDMVDHHELAEAARKRANDLLGEAEREAATMRSEADKYAVNSLANLADQVTKLQREIENGMRALTGR